MDPATLDGGRWSCRSRATTRGCALCGCWSVVCGLWSLVAGCGPWDLGLGVGCLDSRIEKGTRTLRGCTDDRRRLVSGLEARGASPARVVFDTPESLSLCLSLCLVVCREHTQHFLSRAFTTPALLAVFVSFGGRSLSPPTPYTTRRDTSELACITPTVKH